MHRSYRTRCGVFLQAKRKKLIANDQFELAGYIRKAIGSVGSGKESAGQPGPSVGCSPPWWFRVHCFFFLMLRSIWGAAGGSGVVFGKLPLSRKDSQLASPQVLRVGQVRAGRGVGTRIFPSFLRRSVVMASFFVFGPPLVNWSLGLLVTWSWMAPPPGRASQRLGRLRGLNIFNSFYTPH